MSKHTAGPWRVGDAGHTVFGPPNGNPSPELICTGPNKSNIRLAASAPDLLAALEAIVRLADGCLPHDIGIQARAAIARARGA